MTTVLITIGATYAVVIAIAAMLDRDVREGIAGVFLYPLLIVAEMTMRLIAGRYLIAGPRRMGRQSWTTRDDVQTTVIVAGRRRALVYLSEAPTTQDGDTDHGA